MIFAETRLLATDANHAFEIPDFRMFQFDWNFDKREPAVIIIYVFHFVVKIFVTTI